MTLPGANEEEGKKETKQNKAPMGEWMDFRTQKQTWQIHAVYVWLSTGRCLLGHANVSGTLGGLYVSLHCVLLTGYGQHLLCTTECREGRLELACTCRVRTGEL